jgi:hypothetical protein
MRHLSKAVLIFTLAFQASAQANQIFNYSDFTSLTGLSLVGSATAASGVVTLTLAATQQAGALWFDTPVAVVDGFDTEFDYTIDQLGTPAADGIAFVIQTQGIGALGNPGADLGYGGIVDSVGVSLRAVYPLLEINSCGPGLPTSPGNCVVSSTSPASLQGSHTVEIRYTPGTLDILIDGVGALSGAIDLSSALTLGPGGSAYVGITGGTGGFVERNSVESWALTTIPEPGTLFLLTGILPLLAMFRVFRKKSVRGL